MHSWCVFNCILMRSWWGEYTGVLFCTVYNFFPRRLRPKFKMIQTGRVHNQVHVIATKNRISSHVLSNNGLRLHSMPSTLLSLVLVVNSDRFHKFYGVTCTHSYSSHPFLWALLGGIYRNTFLCTVYNFFPRRLRPKFKNSKNDPNRSSTHSGSCTVVIATSQPVKKKKSQKCPSMQASRNSMHSSHPMFLLTVSFPDQTVVAST